MPGISDEVPVVSFFSGITRIRRNEIFMHQDGSYVYVPSFQKGRLYIFAVVCVLTHFINLIKIQIRSCGKEYIFTNSESR